MSDWSDYCDALIADLTANVSSLFSATTHRYAPWNPEELLDDNAKHLAVWPASEGPEGSEPVATGSHLLNKVYRVLYWESAAGSADRGKEDEAAAKAMLDLHNAVRARLYVYANENIGGTIRSWYAGSQFPERSSQVRWFGLEVHAMSVIGFT